MILAGSSFFVFFRLLFLPFSPSCPLLLPFGDGSFRNRSARSMRAVPSVLGTTSCGAGGATGGATGLSRRAGADGLGGNWTAAREREAERGGLDDSCGLVQDFFTGAGVGCRPLLRFRGWFGRRTDSGRFRRGGGFRLCFHLRITCSDSCPFISGGDFSERALPRWNLVFFRAISETEGAIRSWAAAAHFRWTASISALWFDSAFSGE